MKTLSDYKGEESIELWADILSPMLKIATDTKLRDKLKGKAPYEAAKEVLKDYKTEICEILLRIDDTPIDGMNLLTRLASVMIEVMQNEEMIAFLDLPAGLNMTQNTSSGSATDNTMVQEK